jgi:hypothetical protein
MKAALIIIASFLLALVSVVLILNAITPARPPKGEIRLPETGIAPSAPKGPSVGYGEPNDFCATNRLGESFEFNGVTYTCSGPKPYRWRPQK